MSPSPLTPPRSSRSSALAGQESQPSSTSSQLEPHPPRAPSSSTHPPSRTLPPSAGSPPTCPSTTHPSLSSPSSRHSSSLPAS
ncbi:hypothetical protein LINPERHAP1_LOCUS4312 [Linum perenne]